MVKTRSKSSKKKQFRIVREPVYIQPDEVFEFSLEIDEQNGMDAALYGELVVRASV